jgi:hypothetical protein
METASTFSWKSKINVLRVYPIGAIEGNGGNRMEKEESICIRLGKISELIVNASTSCSDVQLRKCVRCYPYSVGVDAQMAQGGEIWQMTQSCGSAYSFLIGK